ncbi:invasion protein IalB [Aliiruegeria haliotis]|uniref:Invasion protein IalB n=1 Tax=Aliiruegeria haliotis TaxID=1280846 RepID=A0A2T0RXQ5_9RHOB|nr:invasion associated locus B family protein [Aliiruegeria haliotis]PRY25937.1 invasion protein IalB [Aliiruegeria haliotis]
MILDAQSKLTALALAALLAATPSFAQEATTEQPAEEQPAEAATDAPAEGSNDLNLDMGTPIDQAGDAANENALGTTYVLEVSGDWEVRCVRTPLKLGDESADPCALHQLLRDESNNPVATIELVNLPAGQQAVAGATIVTPLETLLTEQITLSVDGGQGRRYPFTFCTQQGCIARVGFTNDAVSNFKRGSKGTLSIVPATAPDQQVALNISLSGFTAGFDRLQELNARNAEALEAARAAADSDN